MVKVLLLSVSSGLPYWDEDYNIEKKSLTFNCRIWNFELLDNLKWMKVKVLTLGTKFIAYYICVQQISSIYPDVQAMSTKFLDHIHGKS